MIADVRTLDTTYRLQTDEYRLIEISRKVIENDSAAPSIEDDEWDDLAYPVSMPGRIA